MSVDIYMKNLTTTADFGQNTTISQVAVRTRWAFYGSSMAGQPSGTE